MSALLAFFAGPLGRWLVVAALIAAAAAAIGLKAYNAGATEQKVADQAQFDDINQALADQKSAAAAILKARNAENLALMVERDQLKTHLEKTREDNRKVTTATRDRFAGLGLRFKPAEAAGRGCGRGSAAAGAAGPATPDAAAAVELPGKIASDLRQITFDADTLADEYRKCYGYAEQVR